MCQSNRIFRLLLSDNMSTTQLNPSHSLNSKLHRPSYPVKPVSHALHPQSLILTAQESCNFGTCKDIKRHGSRSKNSLERYMVLPLFIVSHSWIYSFGHATVVPQKVAAAEDEWEALSQENLK